jgi:hypothetical protein
MTPVQLALGEGCQRWRQRRAAYRPPGEPFDAARCGVEVIDERTAKPWVIAHHYSGSYPAARLRVGLFVKERFAREALGGVAVFSVPMSQAVIPKYLDSAPAAGVELGRFVLLDHPVLTANAETWFLARAFRALRRQLAPAGVVAFCDPQPRLAIDGSVTKRGHTGTIYRAHNARYAGRTSARTLLLLPDGRIISERTVAKFRSGERGAEYAERLLRDAGCRRRRPGETPTGYLAELLAAGALRQQRHPGNFAFTWALG